MQKKTVTISFLGNAHHDTRVTNLINSLSGMGIDVKVISFDWTTPNFNPVMGNISICKLDKKKNSFPFYLKFLSVLFKELLKKKAGVYLAEDIFTLPLVTFVAKFRGAKVYYNSREFYAFLGGLRKKPKIQAIIRVLERFFIKKVDKVFVTGDGDSDFLREYYGIENTIVVRNLPRKQKAKSKKNFHEILKIPENQLLLLYQGVILEGRGFEPLLNVLADIPNYDLIVLGTGVYRGKYEAIAEKLNIKKRVHFLGNINQSELIEFTSGADIGVALIENISKSYYYALPNKLFEYIMAELPVVVSNLPQMKKVVEKYRVGEVVDIEEENNLKNVLLNLAQEKERLALFKNNAKLASEELNWENEFKGIRHLF